MSALPLSLALAAATPSSSQKKQSNPFLLVRELFDRRISLFSDLPYMTEEGLVMVDRRDYSERRAQALPASTGAFLSH